MNHKTKRILTLLMVAAMILSLPVISASADDLDLSREVKVTFTKGPSGFDDDIDNASVVVDLYKVASAILEKDANPPQASHGSMYVFTDDIGIGVPTSYAAMQSADWPALTQAAAKKVLLDGEGSPLTTAPTVVDAIDETTAAAGIEAGLYLVVAHGSALATPDKYVKMVSGNVTTFARSDSYTYIYSPELIAIPSTLDEMGIDAGDHVDYNTYKDPEGNVHQGTSTAGGNWQYTINALLKPTREDRLGNLKITKVIPAIDENGSATFVFHVHAAKGDPDKPNYFTYDVDVSLTLTAGKLQDTYEILHVIPVGATVTVTEKYDGTRFKADGATEQTDKIPPLTITNGQEAALSFTFENSYNGKIITGYGIENQFKCVPSGTGYDWQFTQNPPTVIEGQPEEGAVS